jgi:5-methylcytosine-specific restriction endonuclease McrA
MNYREKLMDPRWQRKRLEVFQRAGWKCQACGTTERTLHVHHLVYSKGYPWEAPDHTLESLCDDCHDWRTKLDRIVGYRHMISTKLMRSDTGVQKAVRHLTEVQAAREIGGATED